MAKDSLWWLLTRIVLWGALAEGILLGMLWLLTTYAPPMPPDLVPPHLCCWRGE